jgi:hypothetical protein
MTQISKWNAMALSIHPETCAQMFAFARTNAIPEMAQQARTMVISGIIVRVTAALSPFLLMATANTRPNSMGEYALTFVSAANTGVSACALKKLYGTACYLQGAVNRFPDLRARLGIVT